MVPKARITYNIQEKMHMEGVFTIKVTPQGTNLCLLEEAEEGEFKAMVNMCFIQETKIQKLEEDIVKSL